MPQIVWCETTKLMKSPKCTKRNVIHYTTAQCCILCHMTNETKNKIPKQDDRKRKTNH